MKTKFMIYGCGGTGVNLLQDKIQIPNLPTHPAWEAVRVDLSESNMDPACPLPNFLIPGAKGAGKDRREALRLARPHIPSILEQHQPGTFNVVLYAAAGGSGSVLGPLLSAELLRRGLPTLVMMVGATTSGKETQNTLAGFLSLQQQVNSNRIPLSFCYYENSLDETGRMNTGDRPTVDQTIADDISKLAMLVSERHRELDRLDIRNFLRYESVANVEPQLTELIIGDHRCDWSIYRGQVVATASLLVDPTHQAPELTQPYKCEGFYQDAVLEEHGDKLTDLTFALTAANNNVHLNRLKDMAAEYDSARSTLNNNSGFDMSGVADEEDDIVI